MKRTIQILTLAMCSFSMTSCSPFMKVSERSENGYFKSINTNNVITIKSEKVNLDDYKGILVVPKSENNFIVGMMNNINYFEKVMTFDDLEKEIIKENKQDEIGEIRGRIGLNNVSKKYKKFLYITIKEPAHNKMRIELTNPETADDLLISEVKYDNFWTGVSDAEIFNPLFNELIKYIENNSATYKK